MEMRFGEFGFANLGYSICLRISVFLCYEQEIKELY